MTVRRSMSARIVGGDGVPGGCRSQTSGVCRRPGATVRSASSRAWSAGPRPAVRCWKTWRCARRRVSQANRSIRYSAGATIARAHLLNERGHERHAAIGAQRGGEQPGGHLAIGERVERSESEGPLDLAEVLASRFIAVLCILPHHRRVEIELRGDVGQNRLRDVLVGAERPAGEPQIAEMDGKAYVDTWSTLTWPRDGALGRPMKEYSGNACLVAPLYRR